MTIEHIAIWTNDIERLKNYYIDNFNGTASAKYTNPKKQFESYFVSFGAGARIEIMTIPNLAEEVEANGTNMRKGLTHIAFATETMADVNNKAKQLAENGFTITNGPRVTGDGYYEFETLDPDGNRIEVTTIYVAE